MKKTGKLRYTERLRFYVETEDGSRYVASDYEQTVCTRNELLCLVSFHINENDEACEIDLIDEIGG